MTPHDLIAAFDVLAEAPDGVDRLRELVLQLAVRGKLVTQDPADEPASVLLERIARERSRLVKRGVLRRRRAVAELPAEPPFQPPNGWRWSRLADVVLWDLTDGDWVESRDQDPDGGIRLVQLADVGAGIFLDRSRRFLNGETFERLRCTALETNDVLIARMPRPIGRACLFPGLSQPAVTVVDVAIARCAQPSIDARFLVHLMNSPVMHEQVETVAAGTTRQRVSTGNLRELLIPVPPLAEQQRIVERVDVLMALLDYLQATHHARETARATLRDAAFAALRDAETRDDVDAAWTRIAENLPALVTTPADLAPLRETILQLAVRGRLVPQNPADEPARPVTPSEVQVTPPFEAPSGWVWARVQDVGEVKLGRQRAPQHHNGPHMVPYLRVANVQDGWLDLRDVKHMNFTPAEQETYRLQANDILLNEGQSRELVGRAALFRGEIPDVCFQKTLLRFRSHDVLVAEFALIVFRAYMHGGRFAQAATQTTNMAHLPAIRFAPIEFPLPPLNEQHRIIDRLDILFTHLDTIERRLIIQAEAHAAFAAAAVHHIDG